MRKSSFLILLLFLLFTGCNTTSLLQEKYTDPLVLSPETLCPQDVQWEPVYQNKNEIPGFQKAEYIINDINTKWTCVKVDLNTPNLKITAEPSKDNLHKRFQLKAFAKKQKTTVAINTTPFDIQNKTWLPVSVVKIDDEIICNPNSSYSALCFKEVVSENDDQKVALRAFILTSQSEENLEQYPFAFGGFFTILEDQTIYSFEKHKRSRTAAGISQDGRYLYLFAACGINCPTGRNGLNFEECALILQKLGCYKAMEMDGGHSTGLCINQENTIKPSLQRRIPAALGIIWKYNNE